MSLFLSMVNCVPVNFDHQKTGVLYLGVGFGRKAVGWGGRWGVRQAADGPGSEGYASVSWPVQSDSSFTGVIALQFHRRSLMDRLCRNTAQNPLPCGYV